MPRFADGSLINSYRLARYGDSPIDALVGMATHPQAVLGDLATAQTFGVVVALLAPVAFLAVFAPRFLLAALPLQAAYWLSTQAGALSINFHYQATAIPFVVAALAIALSRLPSAGGWRAPATAVVAAGVCLLAWGNDSPLSPQARGWARTDSRDAAMEDAIALVPAGEGVAASYKFLPSFADRPDLQRFPRPFAFSEDIVSDPLTLPERQSRIRWIVIEPATLLDDETAILRRLIDSGQFRAVFDERGVAVYERIAPGEREDGDDIAKGRKNVAAKVEPGLSLAKGNDPAPLLPFGTA